MSMKTIKYDDLEPITIHVKVGRNHFILREMDEEANVAYEKIRLVGVTFTKGTNDEVVITQTDDSQMANLPTVVLSKCLYNAAQRVGTTGENDDDWVLPTTDDGLPDRNQLVRENQIKHG